MVASTEEPETGLAAFSERNTSIHVHVARWRVNPKRSAPTSVVASASPSKPHVGFPSPIPRQPGQRNAFKEQFFSLYLAQTFPTICNPGTSFAGSNNWMLEILRLPALSPALENATLAVSAAKLGRRDQKPDLVHQSLGLYTQSLHEFSYEVGNVSSRRNEQTLAACMVMMMYEVSECPGGNPDGYQAHYAGTMRLLEMRGPEAHISGLAHSIFQSLRVHTMYQSFIQRSTAMLSKPEWCNVPFDRPKDHFDQLLDILLDIPSHFSERRHIGEMTDPQLILQYSLDTVRQSLRTEERLADWFGSFEDTVPGPLYYPELSIRQCSNDERALGMLFPIAFRFPAPSVAQNLIFYWTALLSIHAHLISIYDMLSGLMDTLDMIRADLPCTCDSGCLRHFEMGSLPPLGRRRDWPRTIAYYICQSMEYCLQDNGRGFGPVSVLPVLSVVKAHWTYWPGDWTREIAWVDEVLLELGQKSTIARFL
ncbi:hypothetical protein SUNI508_06531 [Seiridium unicorne]|uniref:Uncharacterized protein n=1 Tax=Seiridium unicorne TaxID=138068 RepID=A0ABR2UZY5_9PEZI